MTTQTQGAQAVPTVADLAKETSTTINRIRGVYSPFAMRDSKDRPDVLEAEDMIAKSSALVLNGVADVSVFRDALGAFEQAYMNGLKELRQHMHDKMKAQGYSRCG